MEQHRYESWMKVKAALEALGKTDSPFYQRALIVMKTRRDPEEDVTFNAGNKLS